MRSVASKEQGTTPKPSYYLKIGHTLYNIELIVQLHISSNLFKLRKLSNYDSEDSFFIKLVSDVIFIPILSRP